MRFQNLCLLALVSLAAPLAACSSSESTSGGTSQGAGGSSTGTMATTGTGGAGTGGAGTGGVGTGGMGTGGMGTGGMGGGTGAPGDHLLISEVGVAPAGGEFIEIENPTAAEVDLTNYYISDNSAYYQIATGMPWMPMTMNPGTDFLAQFPAGTKLAPGAMLVIATDPASEQGLGKCPDFILAAADLKCQTGTAKAMVTPKNGSIGDQAGALLSNAREMVMLFTWDGDITKPVKDVDYVTWGDMFDDNSRSDKTGIMGYLADTPRMNQKPAVAPAQQQSIERCGAMVEQGEKATGGNGITGHDETSEPLDTNFKLQKVPTPGAKNTCM